MSSRSKNIIMTGYRATGKSTVGRRLANELGLKFIDTDKMIEKRHGPISTLVKEHGWDFFRTEEQNLLEQLCEEQGLVIATGGGAILHNESWEKLKKTGLVVWLLADEETIAARLSQDAATSSQRPTLTGGNVLGEISEVLLERTPLYKKGSHLKINTTDKTIDEIIEIIKKKYCPES